MLTSTESSLSIPDSTRDTLCRHTQLFHEVWCVQQEMSSDCHCKVFFSSLNVTQRFRTFIDCKSFCALGCLTVLMVHGLL